MWALVHAGGTDFEAAVQLRTTRALLQEIGERVAKDTQKLLPYLQHINSLLTNALLKCKVVDDDENACNTPTKPFLNKQYIAPGKCPEHQWKFQKTTKTPGRKKAVCTLRFACINTCHAHGNSKYVIYPVGSSPPPPHTHTMTYIHTDTHLSLDADMQNQKKRRALCQH